MQIYNTLTRKKEEFVPHTPGVVKMYTCGPTVYNYAHIGNLRTYIFEDILEKTLRYLGYDVTRAMNITDVGHLTSDSDSGEDKMVKESKKEQKSVLDIAHFYTEAFKRDTKKLNIKWPDIVSPATENIPMYFKIISKLLDTGYAYISGGNVYFDTSKVTDYYRLTNDKYDSMVVGVREGVLEDKNKKNQADFVLWFTKSKFDAQELKWVSPWGVGYPGWHIECSGISIANLGEYLDIHCGGVDNIFPHHTNEIAQSEAYLGHPWCKYWVHGEHLNDETGKMSKSKGDFLTVSLLESKGYNPIVYRFMCLNSHYRNQLVFSYANLDNMKSSYEKLKNKVSLLNREGEFNQDRFDYYNDKFKSFISDDLNTANAISLIYELLKSDESDALKYNLISSFDQVLSLNLCTSESISLELRDYIEEKINERNEAKIAKNYALADEIRENLLKKGIVLKDTKEGTTYSFK